MPKKKTVRLTHPATGQVIETTSDLADRYRANGWQDVTPERGDQ